MSTFDIETQVCVADDHDFELGSQWVVGIFTNDADAENAGNIEVRTAARHFDLSTQILRGVVWYPNVTWVDQGEIDGDDRRWKGTATGFEIDLRYQWGGKWKGHWTVIVNHGAIQTGHGEHGYLFDSVEEAKEAAETEIKRRVSEKVKSALAVLDTYTDVPIGGYNE